jgi:hypothetical protein
MKTIFKAAAVASLLTLAACGGAGDDTAGDNVADMADNKADVMEDMADNTNNEMPTTPLNPTPPRSASRARTRKRRWTTPTRSANPVRPRFLPFTRSRRPGSVSFRGAVASALLDPFDPLCGFVQYGGDVVQAVLAHLLGGHPVPQRRQEVAHGALDRPPAGPAPALALT